MIDLIILGQLKTPTLQTVQFAFDWLKPLFCWFPLIVNLTVKTGGQQLRDETFNLVGLKVKYIFLKSHKLEKDNEFVSRDETASRSRYLEQ